MEETKEVITLFNWLHQYKPQLFIVAGLILTGIGGWLSFERMIKYRTNSIRLLDENRTLGQENKELNEKIKIQSEKNGLIVKKNENLGKENIKLTNQNQELINSNILITKSNSRLSNKLLDRTEIINSEITGGDTYVYVTASYNKLKNEIDIKADVVGDYNLKNVTILIDQVTLSEEKRILKQTFDEMSNQVIQVLTNVKGHRNLENIFFRIMVIANNGIQIQYSLLKKYSDSDWYSHSLHFFGDQYVVKELYSRSYPNELKNKFPTYKDYGIKYDVENTRIKNAIKGSLRAMLKDGSSLSLKRISTAYNIPMKVVLEIEEELLNKTK